LGEAFIDLNLVPRGDVRPMPLLDRSRQYRRRKPAATAPPRAVLGRAHKAANQDVARNRNLRVIVTAEPSLEPALSMLKGRLTGTA